MDMQHTVLKMSGPPPQTPSPHELEFRNLPPTFRDFFPLHDAAETDADICRDIALLSALLNDYHGKSTVKQGRSSSYSDLWSHLAYTLVPGSSDDPTGNKVVAVVGRIEPGSIIATVARNTSPKFTPMRRQNPVEVDRVAVHPHDNVKEMLQNPLTLHVGKLGVPLQALTRVVRLQAPCKDDDTLGLTYSHGALTSDLQAALISDS